ncbi:MAG: glutamine--fructose-6-phosphate transaminase (isomerizing) [Alphaproteobacteria bacterium]
MCGIVGYIGGNAALDNLLDGLKNLEYRGYDSAGIALNDSQETKVYRAEGKLDNLCNIFKNSTENFMPCHVGIGHIRWATHGEPTVQNAHPHRATSGKFVLVHNGIIENYKELKEKLMSEGYLFQSETDTEVAVNLIDRESKKFATTDEAIISAVNQLKGAFAFCIMCDENKDEIIAVRKNAPLIVGLGKNENFIASDVAAILGKVDEMVYLDDEEIAFIKKNEILFKSFSGEIISKKPEKISIEAETISKQNYKHFMLKEICEQAGIVRHILSERMISASSPILLSGVNLDLEKIKRIEIVACGSSLHAALAVKNSFEELLKTPVFVEPASEYIYRQNLTDENTLFIGISQSGETADTITAVKQAKENKAHILIVTNRTDSTITRYANSIIPLRAGIEVSVAATKSYVAQLVSLFLLALFMAEKKGAKMTEIKQEFLELPSKVEQILSHLKEIQNVAQRLCFHKDFFYIARGMNVATALEGALKLKEISYLNAGGYPAGELKHGPIALLDEKAVVVSVLVPNTPIYDKILSNCAEAKARKAKLVVITSSDDEDLKNQFDEVIKIPSSLEIFSTVLSTIPMQLLAYYISDYLGREIDQPRNLAKSVTVE